MKTQIWTPSDWSIRKWQGWHFFKFPKNRFSQFWSYVAIFSFIVWWFEARNISNDRECFSLQNGLLLIIFEGHLLWEKNTVREKKSIRINLMTGNYFSLIPNQIYSNEISWNEKPMLLMSHRTKKWEVYYNAHYW
jgi:hypothetical protein